MRQLLMIPILLFSFWTPVTQHSNTATVIEKHICPVCKTDKDVIPIVYGKPGTELMQKAERGECKLGGCVISPDSPHFYCKKDKKEF